MKPFRLAWAALGLVALATTVWFLVELEGLREASEKGLLLTITPQIIRYTDRDFGSQHTVFTPFFGSAASLIIAMALGLLFAQAVRWRHAPRSTA
ncbi:hypothetical protein [Diaminobutyricimonas sp. TR449]|uniref:hypothetical protein n=1 Tax=Diaminobutyricimonas sp. TR449 TaxID=2708076 RepID=UPI00141D90BC|nr:hypothetical protein [Diaminobutyricimonas sp. TR449]